jgi:hypothetical protein
MAQADGVASSLWAVVSACANSGTSTGNIMFFGQLCDVCGHYLTLVADCTCNSTTLDEHDNVREAPPCSRIKHRGKICRS